jgi:hypothetical protein
MGDNDNINWRMVQEMQRQINDLTTALAQTQAQVQTQGATGRIHDIPTERPKPKPVMDKLKPYDNTDRRLYQQFEAKLRARLYVDRGAIGGPFEQIWVAFRSLTGDAAKKLYPWMKTYASNVEGVTEDTLEQFFKQMQFYFTDEHMQSKAAQQLYQLRQSNKPFNEYLREFERLVLEAGGATWDDAMKSELLLNGTNLELQRALASMPPLNTFVEFTRQAQRTADRLETVTRAERAYQKRKNPRAGAAMPPAPPPIANKNANDAMDWTPTQANKAQANKAQRRAKWATPEELERRRADPDRCLRCGGSGHYVKNCPYLPPLRPKVQVKKTVTMQSHAPDLSGDEGSESDRSKNEWLPHKAACGRYGKS